MTTPQSTAPDAFNAPRRDEATIDELASRQHGIVTRRQLLTAGIASHIVERRVKVRRLRPVYRGVYRVGPVAAPHGEEMAAVLACGPSAALSHRSAAVLWRLMKPSIPPASVVDVTITSGNRRRRGIRIHRIGTLEADESTELDGIPITTPGRTLFDLAGCLGPRELERAVAKAFDLRLTEPDRMRTLLTRHAGRTGSDNLRAVLTDGRPALTRSEAEERFLTLVRKASLRAPAVNADAAGYEVDFLWRDEGLVIEIDGFTFHSSRRAFEGDRRRDAVLAAAGLRVIRVTWRQLVNESEAVLARLAQALARAP